MPSATGHAHAVYDRLQSGMPDLIRDLRHNGYKAGVDQYLSAQSLFLSWETQPELSSDAIRASLSALFSTTADEQQRFHLVFRDWYERCLPEKHPPDDSGLMEMQTPPAWVETVKLDRKAGTAIILWLVLALCIAYRFYPGPEEKIPKPPIITSPVEILGPGKSKSVPIVPHYLPPPRTPAEPVVPPEPFYFQYSAELQTAFWLPLFLWAGWLLRRARLRYLTLRKTRSNPKEKARLESLPFKKDKNDLLPPSDMKSILRWWRNYQPFRSHRLHQAGTVRRILVNSGYFQPMYRGRMLPPEHVLLIDRWHQSDFAAGMAEELKQCLQAEGLFITTYYYDIDPRYCWPGSQRDRYFSLAQLATRHQNQHLIAIGDAGSFYRVTDNQHLPWGHDGDWGNKTLMTVNSPEDWGAPEQALMRLGFQITPFTRRGINRLIALKKSRLGDQDIRQIKSLDYRDAPLPQTLRPYAYPWLDERKPDRQQRAKSISALKSYLGKDGYCLLAAVAAYPALNWHLALALDKQLQLEDGENRQIRLRKLARLPWFRNGNLPDAWRRVLIRSLKPPMLKKIYGCYHALMNCQSQAGGDTATLIQLPVAIPDLTGDKKARDETIHSAPRGDALQDAVFASVIRGRKPNLLEFPLSPMLKRWVPPEYWCGIIGPALLGLFLAAGTTYYAITAWRSYSDRFLMSQAYANMKRRLGDYRIEITYRDSTGEAQATALQNALRAWGFQVSALTEDKSVQDRDTLSNRLEVAEGIPDAIAQLAEQRLRYMAYGANVRVDKNPQLPAGTLRIDFRRLYETGSTGVYYRDFIYTEADDTQQHQGNFE